MQPIDIHFPIRPAEVRLILERIRDENLASLKLGQRVEAVALSCNDKGVIRLQMAGREIIAQSAIQIQPGQRLQLVVVKAGERPELRLAPLPSVPATVQTKQDALRVTLPRQQPLDETLTRLQACLENPRTPLPTPVRETAQAVLQLLPDHPEPPDAAVLKTLIQGSGVFLEARLAAGMPPSGPDLKVALLNLLSQVRAAGTEARPPPAPILPHPVPNTPPAIPPPVPAVTPVRLTIMPAIVSLATAPTAPALDQNLVTQLVARLWPDRPDEPIPVQPLPVNPREPSPLPVPVPSPVPPLAAAPTAPVLDRNLVTQLVARLWPERLDEPIPVQPLPVNPREPLPLLVPSPVPPLAAAPTAPTAPALDRNLVTQLAALLWPDRPDEPDEPIPVQPLPVNPREPSPLLVAKPLPLPSPVPPLAAAPTAPALERNLVTHLAALLWPDRPDEPIPVQPLPVNPRESSPLLVAKPMLLPSQIQLPAEDTPPATTEPLAPPHHLDDESRALRDIGQQGESALARVRYHQLASLPSDDGTKVAWHLEIPLQVGGLTQSFECRIEEDDESAGRGKGGERGFTLDLAFDFSALGPSHARLRVRASQVGVVFWAERQSTVALMHDHLEQLAARLRAVGLEVGSLQAYQGKPPRSVASRPVIPPLLDEKA